jgi:hypothetical protein
MSKKHLATSEEADLGFFVLSAAGAVPFFTYTPVASAAAGVIDQR